MQARLVTLLVVGVFTISGCESQKSKATAILKQHEQELLKLEEDAAFDKALLGISRGYQERGNTDMSSVTGAYGVQAAKGTLGTRDTLARLFREECRSAGVSDEVGERVWKEWFSRRETGE